MAMWVFFFFTKTICINNTNSKKESIKNLIRINNAIYNFILGIYDAEHKCMTYSDIFLSVFNNNWQNNAIESEFRLYVILVYLTHEK